MAGSVGLAGCSRKKSTRNRLSSPSVSSSADKSLFLFFNKDYKNASHPPLKPLFQEPYQYFIGENSLMY
jgi:hypothetical protein